MAWVEGLTNSQRVLFTLANILTTSNKTLVKRYRKTVDNKVVDFELEDTGAGVWRDVESGETVDLKDYTEVMVPSNIVDPKKNWELVYATGGSTDIAEAELNLTSKDKWETVAGFDAKRIILKTKTTPVDVDASYDEYNTDPDSKVDSIEMFLEIVKYRYAINPELNLEITEHPVTGEAMRMANNHSIEVRYGDLMNVKRQYVVDIATSTEQENMAFHSGQICIVSRDPQTELDVYKPVSEEDVDKYRVVTLYGDRLLAKDEGGHPSEFSKYSWYMDFKEQLVDELDGGPSSDDISKGIRLLPQILSGMSETIPIQFWINSSNDRVSMVMMGDPTIDYDKYLTSFCYIGKIDNFEGDGTANDTAGNFALTVGSSTVPSKKPSPLIEPIKGKVEIRNFEYTINNVLQISKTDSSGKAVTEDNVLNPDEFLTEGYYIHSVKSSTAPSRAYTSKKDYVDTKRTGYKFVAFSRDDETFPSDNFDFVYSEKLVDAENPGSPGSTRSSGGSYSWRPEPVASETVDTSGSEYSFTLRIPKPATKIKVYKRSGTNERTDSPMLPEAYVYGAAEPMYEVAEIDLKTVGGVTELDDYYEFTWIEKTVAVKEDDSKKPMPLTKSNASDSPVERDPVLGFVLNVSFPVTWGDQTTATGVSDISMFKTRSGVFNQRHYSSFITPEEYMRKDAFNPSRWTGKFHLSPTYVVHGYDGYRGWLKDTVIVDNTSIVHLDELIVNKDSKDENKPQEIYKYFKLNAPFSFLNNSPNYNYGVGILKSKNYIDDKGNKVEVHI